MSLSPILGLVAQALKRHAGSEEDVLQHLTLKSGTAGNSRS